LGITGACRVFTTYKTCLTCCPAPSAQPLRPTFHAVWRSAVGHIPYITACRFLPSLPSLYFVSFLLPRYLPR
jgi:hypothetical protein